MQVNPYLFYNGNCEEALKYYQKVARRPDRARCFPMKADRADMPVPPDWKNKLMHASITIDGEVLMASDAMPGDYHQPQGFSVSLRSRIPRRPSVGSTRWPRAARCACRSARPSSPTVLACASTSSAFPGW